MTKLRVIWANSAKAQLKSIYDYYKYKKQTPQGAETIKNAILKASREIVFKDQYQVDDIQPQYRRIIVKHYKLLYKVENNTVIILRIFNTYQNPEKQLK